MKTVKACDNDSEYFFSIIHSSFLGKIGWIQLPCDDCLKVVYDERTIKKHERAHQFSFEKLQLTHYHSKF